MSTFFCLKSANSLTATVHMAVKKKSAQAEKMLNKLRKTQRWAGEATEAGRGTVFLFCFFKSSVVPSASRF